MATHALVFQHNELFFSYNMFVLTVTMEVFQHNELFFSYNMFVLTVTMEVFPKA